MSDMIGDAYEAGRRSALDLLDEVISALPKCEIDGCNGVAPWHCCDEFRRCDAHRGIDGCGFSDHDTEYGWSDAVRKHLKEPR